MRFRSRSFSGPENSLARTTASNGVPSPLTKQSRHSALPSVAQVRASSTNRGSPEPADPLPSSAFRVSPFIPKSSCAAGFAARTSPSGVTTSIAALPFSKYERYRSSSFSSIPDCAVCSVLSMTKRLAQGWPVVSSVVACKKSSAGMRLASFFKSDPWYRSGFFRGKHLYYRQDTPARACHRYKVCY